MRRILPVLVLLLAGCWQQFDPGPVAPPIDDDDSPAGDDDDTSVVDDDDTSVVDDDDTTPVVDDDDTSVVDDDDSSVVDDDDFTKDPDDDDDSSVVDDDDSSVVDDDDSSVVDDDDATEPCDAPINMDIVVGIVDGTGTPSTTLSSTQPLTINYSIQNIGGDGTNYLFPSACLFGWSLWTVSGDPVNAGPDCIALPTTFTFPCAGPPQIDASNVFPIYSLSGEPAPPGTYRLDVDTRYWGVQSTTVTVVP